MFKLELLPNSLCFTLILIVGLLSVLTQVKKPGLEMSTVQSELDLSYRQRYQAVLIPEAYERLILDTYVPKLCEFNLKHGLYIWEQFSVFLLQ